MSHFIIRTFFKGLSLLVPIGLVIYILYWLVIGTVYSSIRDFMDMNVEQGLQWVLTAGVSDFQKRRPEANKEGGNG
ncbi:MAG: hypothetical protein K9J81_10240 [Desulfohalobiaceae bacterium]|nr:hypothetical protein [Desulfohalobiaceae bacterium]